MLMFKEYLTKTILKNMLVGGKVAVTFTKANGEERVMICSLNPDLLPPSEVNVDHVFEDAETQTTFSVFDLEKQAWRSFRYDSIKHVNV